MRGEAAVVRAELERGRGVDAERGEAVEVRRPAEDAQAAEEEDAEGKREVRGEGELFADAVVVHGIVTRCRLVGVDNRDDMRVGLDG